MIAPAFPATLLPPAPFPLVLSQVLTQEVIAPGVRRGRYALVTSAGPLVVEVVALDPHEPSLRLGTVLARDRLVSPGETVSSMARRTHAVAGINADYFDIGQTNQPQNVVVRDGALVRSPAKRIALDVRRDGSVRFEEFAFTGSAAYGAASTAGSAAYGAASTTGSAAYGAASVLVTGCNEWPPQGGASLITPAYGALSVAPGVTVTELVPEGGGGAAIGGLDGRYRAGATSAATLPAAGDVALAFGPAARALAAPPQPGDAVTVATQLAPALPDVTQAVGGGPLLLRAGSAVDDADAPAPEERDVRFPVAGAATQPGGTLLLLTVDGRERATSLGVTRPEFAALMLGLGATNGMAFDSGGSATLVARALGDPGPSVLNAPSDGEERPVADGFFAYSDAPSGPPAALVVRPAPIVALAGVNVPVRLAVVDASGHALGDVHLASATGKPDAIASGTRSHVVTLRAAGLAATVPVRVVSHLASIALAPSVRVPDPGTDVVFSAEGKAEDGRTVALGDRVAWSADRGSFLGPGRYRAAGRDARITARAADAGTTYALPVGRHRVALAFFDAAHAAGWRFATAPPGGPGSLAAGAPEPVLALGYDFRAGERAAYAAASFALPGDPFEFDVEVEGDAGGVALRAAFTNAFNERRAVSLAPRVDWSGWRALRLTLPDDLNPPVRLVALYAVPALGAAPANVAGTLRFRNPSILVAGTP